MTEIKDIKHSSLPQRFWDKVRIAPDGECWEWQGSLVNNGYGMFHHNKSTRAAHRWIWEDLVKPIDGDNAIDHMCHNRACVNPRHLQEVHRYYNAGQSRVVTKQAVVNRLKQHQARHQADYEAWLDKNKEN